MPAPLQVFSFFYNVPGRCIFDIRAWAMLSMYISLALMITLVACIMWHPVCGTAVFPFTDLGPPYYVSHDIMRCKYSNFYPLPWLLVVAFFGNIMQCKCTWDVLQTNHGSFQYHMDRLLFQIFSTLSALGLVFVVQYDYMAWENMPWEQSPRNRHYAGVCLMMVFYGVIHYMIYTSYSLRCSELPFRMNATVKWEKMTYQLIELAYVCMGIVFAMLQFFMLHRSSVWAEYSLLVLMALAFILNVQVGDIVCELGTVASVVAPYPDLSYSFLYTSTLSITWLIFQLAL